jgi:transposase InsO family protein
MMCDVLEVSRSGYYSWANQGFPSARSLENKKLSQEIRLIFLEHKGRYGSRRIRRVLINKGFPISRKRVCKLMKSQGLHCKTKRKFRQTTDSNHDLPIAPNLLKRDFSPANPNQAYVGDITYIPTQEGELLSNVVYGVP